jgi:hypothetical protein
MTVEGNPPVTEDDWAAFNDVRAVVGCAAMVLISAYHARRWRRSRARRAADGLNGDSSREDDPLALLQARLGIPPDYLGEAPVPEPNDHSAEEDHNAAQPAL